MLILTRRVGQAIKIGDEIEITVVQVSGDQVRLGVTAPRNVRVHRTEVLEQIAQENVLAAQSSAETENIERLLGKSAKEKKKRDSSGESS